MRLEDKLDMQSQAEFKRQQTERKRSRILNLRAEGFNMSEIAQIVGCSRSYVNSVCAGAPDVVS
jgi:DNA-directed RNA polymerase specialized sigma24 family protein